MFASAAGGLEGRSVPQAAGVSQGEGRLGRQSRGDQEGLRQGGWGYS